MPTPQFESIVRRLRQAGFEKKFIESALLPDWWSEKCADDEAVVSQLAFRVARFLDAPLDVVYDPKGKLASPDHRAVRFRVVPSPTTRSMSPAIHAAYAVAAAAVRNLRAPSPVEFPSADPVKTRQELLGFAAVIRLDTVLQYLSERGIPVIYAPNLPSPKFQAMACIVGGRPVIVLAHGHDVPAKVAFYLLHETAHIARGDCSPDAPVVDESDLDDVTGESTDEREVLADDYAARVLGGPLDITGLDASGPRNLAVSAERIEDTTRVDAGHVVLAWARRTRDYKCASAALTALWRSHGALHAIQASLASQLDLEGATDLEYSLLQCAVSQPHCAK